MGRLRSGSSPRRSHLESWTPALQAGRVPRAKRTLPPTNFLSFGRDPAVQVLLCYDKLLGVRGRPVRDHTFASLKLVDQRVWALSPGPRPINPAENSRLCLATTLFERELARPRTRKYPLPHADSDV